MGFLYRHQAPVSFRAAMLAGCGGFVAIAVVATFVTFAGTPLLFAPFGASCVLLFSVHNSPLSQPVNVILGHVVATIVGLVCHAVLPDTLWAVAIAVGLSIAVMAALRITHPPAGADPIVVFASSPSWSFVFIPVLAGAVCLVLVAYIYHRLSCRQYPLIVPDHG